MKSISKDIIEKYNSHRITDNKTLLCHAPFANINFAQNGNMTACCFNRSHVFGKYPFQSINDAWYGKKAEDLREYIRNNDLDGGCKLCQLALESENFLGSKSIFYDDYADTSLLQKPKNFLQKIFSKKTKQVSPPRVFEFELDNTCNLECIMCDGYFSSTIRSQREQLPPVKNPYDDKFIDQIAEFLPFVTDLKFLGGEPFLIELYLKIWERVLQVNPDIKIHITTNGTVMNQRIKALLEKLSCGIVVSIDSLDKDNYASIRKRGNLEKVLENLAYFNELTKKKNTYLSLAVCPMRNNWHEMPALTDFANKSDIGIHFNIVWNPGDISLRFATPDYLQKVVEMYTAYQPQIVTPREKMNFQNFTSLFNQVKYWYEDRKQNFRLTEHYAAILGQFTEGHLEMPDEISKQIATLLLRQFSSTADNGSNEKDKLIALSRTIDADKFIISYFKAIIFILSKSDMHTEKLEKKLLKLQTVALQLADKKTFVSDIIRNGPESQFGYFLNEEINMLSETISLRYSMDT